MTRSNVFRLVNISERHQVNWVRDTSKLLRNDVTLACDDGQGGFVRVEGNSTLLAAHSSMFRNVLRDCSGLLRKDGAVEVEVAEVILPDVTAEEMESILEFLVTGSLTFGDNSELQRFNHVLDGLEFFYATPNIPAIKDDDDERIEEKPSMDHGSVFDFNPFYEASNDEENGNKIADSFFDKNLESDNANNINNEEVGTNVAVSSFDENDNVMSKQVNESLNCDEELETDVNIANDSFLIPYKKFISNNTKEDYDANFQLLETNEIVPRDRMRTKCKVCGDIVMHGSRSYHLKSLHLDPEPCPRCDLMIPHKSKPDHARVCWPEDIQRRSYGPARYRKRCPECHLHFLDYNLKLHMKSMHSADSESLSKTMMMPGKIKCSDCGLYYSSRKSLSRHKRIHNK